MAKNRLQDLRDHLFAQLEALADRDKTLDQSELDRAKVLCQVAAQINETARIEIKYLEATGQREERAKGFFGPELPVTVTSRLGAGKPPNGHA